MENKSTVSFYSSVASLCAVGLKGELCSSQAGRFWSSNTAGRVWFSSRRYGRTVACFPTIHVHTHILKLKMNELWLLLATDLT